jgi:PKD repeat protein
LAANLLSGWTGNWSKSTLALSPGGSSSATLTVTSPTSAAGGSYTIGTIATDASATSYAGSATANYVIASSTNVSISVTTDSASYFPGQTVGITVAVTSGGSPVAGASVNVAVTAPNGNATALSATTGSNGLAMLNYRLRKQAMSGMYQAQASIASSRKAASTVFASTTFVVQ